MSYKYYYSNLTDQQKMIISKREENDKLLKQDTEEPVSNNIRETNEKVCPYCESKDIHSTGVSYSTGTCDIGEDMKEPDHFQYECNKCHRYFNVIKSK